MFILKHTKLRTMYEPVLLQIERASRFRPVYQSVCKNSKVCLLCNAVISYQIFVFR
jgi:hypothetical protein